MSSPSGTTKKVLRIDGLDEAIAFLGIAPQTIQNKLRTTNALLGDKAESRAQGHAHIQTGHMRSQIDSSSTADRMELRAKAGYSGYENNRGNPHDFFTRTIAEMEPIIQDAYIQMMNEIFASKGR